MSPVADRQNQVIIDLLARIAFGADEIEKIVKKGKKKKISGDFVLGYNELDGVKSLTDIAKIVGVTKQNMSQVLQTWEEKGIVYNSGTNTRKAYAGLLKLQIKGKSGTSEKKIKGKKKLNNAAESDVKPEVPVQEVLKKKLTMRDAEIHSHEEGIES